jgi:RNA polymerase sigma-70 factor (ECF subfamily)
MPMSPVAVIADEELAARAAAGDAAAFETLVGRHEARVYRLAHRLTGSDADARDVLQDAFLAAYRGLASFRGAARFSTWLYRITTNAALMHRRARRRRPTESLEEFLPQFDEHGRHAPEVGELEAASRADDVLDSKLLAEQARAALERLPDLYREAFVLRDLEEMDTSEVASLLGIDAAAVRQRVHRARLMLRGYLSHLVGAKT